MSIFDNYIGNDIREKKQWEGYLSKILGDKEFYEKVAALCCMDFMDGFKPLSECNINNNYTFTMDGMAFAEDGGGGLYVLLSDGSIGYVDFSDTECGRVAETLKELLELELNCAASWHIYLDKKYIDNPALLEEDTGPLEAEGQEDFEDAYGDEMPGYNELKKEIADRMQLDISEDITKDILPRLYKTATRHPVFMVKSKDENISFTDLINPLDE